MHPRLAHIGMPLRPGDLFLESLELPSADHLEPPSFRPYRCLFVEVDGNTGLLVVSPAEAPGKLNTALHGEVPEGHEGDHIHRPYPWMAAPVLFKVDVPDSHFGRLEERLLDRSRLAHQADHQPIMAPIGSMIQEEASLALPEGVHDGRDDLAPSTFAKVRDTLDELRSQCCGHSFCSNHSSTTWLTSSSSATYGMVMWSVFWFCSLCSMATIIECSFLAQARRATPPMTSQEIPDRITASTRSLPSRTRPKPPLMAFPIPTPPPLWSATSVIPRAAFPA